MCDTVLRITPKHAQFAPCVSAFMVNSTEMQHQRSSHKELNINKDGDLWETKLVFSAQYSFLQNPVIFFKKSTLFLCNRYLIEICVAL